MSLRTWQPTATTDGGRALSLDGSLATAIGESRLASLQRLARAIDIDQDDWPGEHTGRVARLSGLLGARLGLSAADVELLQGAAPLHDIGKIAVSGEILLKPGALTQEELAQMRRHVTSGAAMLAGDHSAVVRLARDIALTHHEWWDGSGYPAGLKGHAIPLCGRIVALADVFDALTHARPYKPAWPVHEAVAEIQRLRGRQFDPAVVDAFERIDATELT